MVYELPLYFDDRAFSVMEIHARLRSLRTRGSLGLIVVDYLQLVRDAAGRAHGPKRWARMRAYSSCWPVTCPPKEKAS